MGIKTKKKRRKPVFNIRTKPENIIVDPDQRVDLNNNKISSSEINNIDNYDLTSGTGSIVGFGGTGTTSGLTLMPTITKSCILKTATITILLTAGTADYISGYFYLTNNVNEISRVPFGVSTTSQNYQATLEFNNLIISNWARTDLYLDWKNAAAASIKYTLLYQTIKI